MGGLGDVLKHTWDLWSLIEEDVHIQGGTAGLSCLFLVKRDPGILACRPKSGLVSIVIIYNDKIMIVVTIFNTSNRKGV